MIQTEAWLIYKGQKGPNNETPGPAKLERKMITFPDIESDEVLVEPLYGCWEGNMTHAVKRDPIDICRRRREEWVVLGNSGVVRVIKTGSVVTSVKEGDICLLQPIQEKDNAGYLVTVFGYDAPNTIGLLAKQTKVREYQLEPLPYGSKHSVRQWAAFSLRYPTAWSNWKVAYGTFRLQISISQNPTPRVWGWGGGVSYAELCLAKLSGSRVAMMASSDERLKLLENAGIDPIDRRAFPDLNYDKKRYETDREYKKRYIKSEHQFIDIVKEKTKSEGVSIFLDNIGQPVYHATLRALSRQGVIATVGWKEGMEISINRAVECIQRHTHVFTHGGNIVEGKECMQFAEETGWMPPQDDCVYQWDDVPLLARHFAEGKIASYFPIYQVNPE